MEDPKEDKEVKKLALEDMHLLEEKLDELEEEIIQAVIPSKPIDGRNCQLEVRQAAGGSESSLFAEDLVNIYKGYCNLKGWRIIEEEFTLDFSI